jgi:hypothetical protein
MLAGVFGTMPRIHQISARTNRSGDAVDSNIVSEPVPSSLLRAKPGRACRIFGPAAAPPKGEANRADPVDCITVCYAFMRFGHPERVVSSYSRERLPLCMTL